MLWHVSERRLAAKPPLSHHQPATLAGQLHAASCCLVVYTRPAAFMSFIPFMIFMSAFGAV